MRSRVLGAALLALGVVALVFAGGLAFVMAPAVKQLPYDMKPTQSVAEAPNATFLQITSGVAKVNTGTLRSTVNVTPDTKETAKLEGSLDGKAMVWQVGQQVQNTGSTELVSAYSTALAIDRKTGAALPWDGQWLDTGNREKVNYSGQIYKFPFGTEKKTYQIFDRDLLGTRPANFVKTEQIEGLETYQFTQEIRNEKQEVPADRMSVLLSQLGPKGATTGEVRYENTRSVWVEPTTGQFIKVQELQKKQLVTNAGAPVQLLDASFVYTDDTIRSAAETAKENRQKLNLVSLWAPLGLAVLGLVLIVVGIILAARRPGAAGAAAVVPTQRRGGARHAAEGTDREAEAPRSADSAKAGKSGGTAD